MNEEMKAQLESLNTMEDAYQLACANGFTGARKDFAQLCVNAAENMTAEAMNMDDMEQVAGGNAITDTAANVWNWCKENPALAIGIGAAATATLGGAIAYGVHRYRASSAVSAGDVLDNGTKKYGPFSNPGTYDAETRKSMGGTEYVWDMGRKNWIEGFDDGGFWDGD